MDHTIGPKTVKNSDNYSTAPKKNMTRIDPKNSDFKNRKIRCRIIRFKSIFCDFFANFPQKSNLTPVKDWR